MEGKPPAIKRHVVRISYHRALRGTPVLGTPPSPSATCAAKRKAGRSAEPRGTRCGRPRGRGSPLVTPLLDDVSRGVWPPSVVTWTLRLRHAAAILQVQAGRALTAADTFVPALTVLIAPQRGAAGRAGGHTVRVLLTHQALLLWRRIDHKTSSYSNGGGPARPHTHRRSPPGAR